MGLSQGKMAGVLGVPSNTLSRWEIGTTVPDATSLAAFYSIAKEHGITPVFFGLLGDGKPFPYDLIVLWDFQTMGPLAPWVQFAHNAIVDQLNKRFSGMSPILKAFTHPSQTPAAKELEKLGWRVTKGEDEVRDYIIEDARSDAGQNPEGTVAVLISIDDAFVELIEELKSKGVQVYVMSSLAYGSKLCETVEPRSCIRWDPVSLEQPKRTLKNPPMWLPGRYRGVGAR